MSTKSDSRATAIANKSKKQRIPNYLIKETIDGIPFYYKGFRSVLNKTKTKADIMADSGLKGFIKMFLVTILAQKLDLTKYHFFVGETGAHLDRRNNLSLDLSIFEQKVLTPDKITTKYIDVHPKIVIEIDVNVEVEDPSSSTFDQFVLRKVRKLHKFGTEKIIWIFSKSETIIVATPDNKWDVMDWDNEVEILDGISFNVAKYLKEKGISLDA